MSRPDPITQRYVITKVSEGLRRWMGATVLFEADGEQVLHIILRNEENDELRCRGQMNRRMGRVTGQWDAKHGFELKVQRNPNGPVRLHCEIHELPGRMTSDSWSADEDGP